MLVSLLFVPLTHMVDGLSAKFRFNLTIDEHEKFEAALLRMRARYEVLGDSGPKMLRMTFRKARIATAHTVMRSRNAKMRMQRAAA